MVREREGRKRERVGRRERERMVRRENGRAGGGGGEVWRSRVSLSVLTV